jgi:hypothetical protein
MLHSIVTKCVSPKCVGGIMFEISASTSVVMAAAYNALVCRDTHAINSANKMGRSIHRYDMIDKLIMAAVAVDDTDLACWFSVYSGIAAHYAPNKLHVFDSHICAMRIAILNGIEQNVNILMCQTIKQTDKLRQLALSSPNKKIDAY